MGFGGAYLGAAPLLKEKMRTLGYNEWTAQLTAGIAAGTAAACVSQPSDTCKTRLQRNFSVKISMLEGIFQKSAFAGLKWRIAMITTATIVMPFVQEKLSTYIEKAQR